MFAIITPALISGAFAERIKFSAMLLFTVLWALVVYFPMAHMVWGKGGLLNAFSGGRFPCFDFAGGTVVNITSGVSALVCAIYLGKRSGYMVEPMKPHNLVLSTGVPACSGWAGSDSMPVALWPHRAWPRAPLSRPISAPRRRLSDGCSRSGSATVSRDARRHLGVCCGTRGDHSASGFVKPFPAMLIGFAAGMICYLMVTTVKSKFRYDDALDAFGVHGIGGTLGALLTGVFATNAVNDALKDASGHPMPLGMVDGNMAAVRVSSCWSDHRGRSGHCGHAHHSQDLRLGSRSPAVSGP